MDLLMVPVSKEVHLASMKARAYWWNIISRKIWALRDLMKFFRACKTVMLCEAYGWNSENLSVLGFPSSLSSYIVSPHLPTYPPLIYPSTMHIGRTDSGAVVSIGSTDDAIFGIQQMVISCLTVLLYFITLM